MKNLKQQKKIKKNFQLKTLSPIHASSEFETRQTTKGTIFLSTTSKRDEIGLIHKVYLVLLKQKRLHLASTKTKSEVRGGGRKPWKQKGTGNARAGSNRSPLWVGGGVSFGPKPHSVSKKINKKEKKKALLILHQYKTKNFQTFSSTICNIPLIHKTKYITTFLKTINWGKNEKILFLFDSNDKNKMNEFKLASRNLNNIFINFKTNLNFIQLLKVDRIIEFTNT